MYFLHEDELVISIFYFLHNDKYTIHIFHLQSEDENEALSVIFLIMISGHMTINILSTVIFFLLWEMFISKTYLNFCTKLSKLPDTFLTFASMGLFLGCAQVSILHAHGGGV